MRPRTVGLALLSGLAALLVVGVAVTEVAATRIEFSLFLGIPAGVAAAITVAAVVFARLKDPEPGRRRPAIALAGFGATFVAVLVLGVTVLRLRNSVALAVAAVVGLAGAAAAIGLAARPRRR